MQNFDILDLNLDAAQLQTTFINGVYCFVTDSSAPGTLAVAKVDVRNDREAKGDCAGARGYGDLGQRTEGVDKRGDTLFRLFEKPGQITRVTAPKISAARMATVTRRDHGVISCPKAQRGNPVPSGRLAAAAVSITIATRKVRGPCSGIP